MKLWLLALVLFLGAPSLRAENAQVGGDVTGTVRVADLDVPRNQILVTPKPDHIHVIWDAFAERDAIRRASGAFHLSDAALDLVKHVGEASGSKVDLFNVDIAEFPVRDDYGAPRWDKITFLGRYVVTRKGHQWTVNKRAG